MLEKSCCRIGVLNKLFSLSHEWIYRFILKDKEKGGRLYLHLRHQHKKYRKRYGSPARNSPIKNRIFIDERPKIVDEKSRIGDWEIDTIIGKNRQQAIITIVERFSKKTICKKIPCRKAEITKEAMVNALKPVIDRVLIITGDNGIEFAEHEAISKALNAQFYFAHPYASWERGLNENTNGLIRQYLHKGSNFSNITKDSLTITTNKLNNRPRKLLDYATPNEMFTTSKLCDIKINDICKSLRSNSMKSISEILENMLTFLQNTEDYLRTFIENYKKGIIEVPYFPEVEFRTKNLNPTVAESSFKTVLEKIMIHKKYLEPLRESIKKKQLKLEKKYEFDLAVIFRSSLKTILDFGGVFPALSNKFISNCDRISYHINQYLEDIDQKNQRLFNRIIKLHKYSGIELLEIDIYGENDFDIMLAGITENPCIKISKVTVQSFSARILLEEEFIDVIQSAPNLFGFEIEKPYHSSSMNMQDFVTELEKQLNKLSKQRDFYIKYSFGRYQVIVKLSSGVVTSLIFKHDTFKTPKSFKWNDISPFENLLFTEYETLSSQAQAEDGLFPADCAVKKNELFCLKYLMNNHMKYSCDDTRDVTTILHLAAEFSNAEILNYLVEFEAIRKLISKKHYPQSIQDLDFECTPIMIAAYRGDLEVLTILIDKFNADININENSPIDIAFNHQKFEVVKFLLESGANITPKLKVNFNEICSKQEDHPLKAFLCDRKSSFENIISEPDLENIRNIFSSNPAIVKMRDLDDHTLLFQIVKEKQYNKYGLLMQMGADFSPEEKSQPIDFGSSGDQQKFDEAVQSHFTRPPDAIAYYLNSHTCIRHSANSDVIMLNIYKKLSAIELVKPILEVIQFARPEPIIIVDMLNEHVGHLIPGYEEDKTRGVYRRASNHVYIAGKRSKESERDGTIIHEMTHFACQLVYKNHTFPYYPDNKGLHDHNKMKSICNDLNLRKREFKSVSELEHVRLVFERYPEEEKQLKELIVRVPQILVIYGKEGYDALNKYTPELLNYYKNEFLPKCRHYILNQGKTLPELEFKNLVNKYSFIEQMPKNMSNTNQKNICSPVCLDLD